jgi:isocitrate/isopropylmalate dehydrogenase
MKLKLAVLPGDGIGPEIMEQGVAVMKAVCAKFGHELSYEYAICGADAIDKVGDPFPEDTFQKCMAADAVLFASVGDPKFDNNPTAKVRPEQGLLAMRKKLGLFANVRPVETFDCLSTSRRSKTSLCVVPTSSASASLPEVCISARNTKTTTRPTTPTTTHVPKSNASSRSVLNMP